MDDFTLYLAAGQGLHPIADWAVDFVLVCGPGIALCTGGYVLLCVVERIRDRRAVRRQRRQLILERAQMARLRAAIEAAPLIPTQPGCDDDLLVACWDAWNADNTEPRKEA